ncbi:MAG: hypothetical protein PHV18_12340 [Lachnospiraceae bacterium]|nr:hypothetical protein [Lachnospiraceae bacterium]
MTTIIACLIATFSTSAFIALWFWVVRKELCAKENMVSAAKRQFTAGRQEYVRARDGLDEAKARDIMERSQSIYWQALNIYSKTLRKPWNTVPAWFLGFRQKSRDDTMNQ